jgi:CPA2 family monovalent cation:H+ antiporter-2
MIGLAALLVGAAIALAVSRLMRIPSTPFLLVAGAILGTLGLLPQEILQETLVLGLTFLLFITGLELSPRRVVGQRRAAIGVGVLQFVFLGAVGFGAAILLGQDLLTAAYIGLALTASSTLVVVRLLQQRGQLFEPFGRMVVGVLLLQDLFIILLIPLLTRTPDGFSAVMIGVLGTMALVGLSYACLRWGAPWLVRLQHEEEVLLIAALTVLFVFVGLADLLGLPLAAGAFLAGVSLSPFPTGGMVRAQLTSVADFFTAIFFLALGGLLIAPSAAAVFQALVLAALVVIITPVLVTIVAERAGLSARPAIESGLLLSQTSELSLVVGLQALAAAQITQETFTILALVTVGTMVLTPFLATEPVVRALLSLHPSTKQRLDLEPPRDHALLLGCGTGGLPLLETLIASGQQVVVIDDDPDVIASLRESDVLCIRGDASEPEALRQAGAHQARLISSTIRRPRDNAGLLRAIKDVPVVVRVFEQADADWVRERGGIPIMYSDAAAEEFAKWYGGWRGEAR